MKLFRTTDIQVVRECQQYFGFQLPSTLIPKRSSKLQSTIAAGFNSISKFVASVRR